MNDAAALARRIAQDNYNRQMSQAREAAATQAVKDQQRAVWKQQQANSPWGKPKTDGYGNTAGSSNGTARRPVWRANPFFNGGGSAPVVSGDDFPGGYGGSSEPMFPKVDAAFDNFRGKHIKAFLLAGAATGFAYALDQHQGLAGAAGCVLLGALAAVILIELIRWTVKLVLLAFWLAVVFGVCAAVCYVIWAAFQHA